MDDEVKGEGNSVNYKYRMHDPRVGRFFAVDPLKAKFPDYSPYSFSGNKLIAYVEIEGMEEVHFDKKFDGHHVVDKIKSDEVLGEIYLNSFQGMGVQDQAFIADGFDAWVGVDDHGITFQMDLYALTEIKKIGESYEYFMDSKTGKTPEEKKIITLYYQLGMVFADAGFDIVDMVNHKTNNPDATMVLVLMADNITDPLVDNNSIDDQRNYASTAIHELSFHMKRVIEGTQTSGQDDHNLAFNYNSSTADWYANTGYTAEHNANNYSPSILHPTSNAYAIESRLLEVFPPSLEVKKVETINVDVSRELAK